MAITSGFFNSVNGDRKYNADQISNMFEGLISDGVYEHFGDALIVKAGEGMQVTVGTGRMLIDGKWLKNDAVLNLPITPSHITQNRYTAIVARLDNVNRTIDIVTKDGPNATTPEKPELSESSGLLERCLAYVYVGREVTQINQADIEDVRADNNLCGWVTGVVDQVNTAELFLQWQNAYEQYFHQMESWRDEQKHLFDEWYKTLSGTLQVGAYIEKYQKVVKTEDEIQQIPLDMTNYEYDWEDVLLVNINGILLSDQVDYTLDTSGDHVSIVFAVPLDSDNTVNITAIKAKIGQMETA